MEFTTRELMFLVAIGILTVCCIGIGAISGREIEELKESPCRLPEKQFKFCTETDENGNWLATVNDQNNPSQTAQWVKEFCKETVGCEGAR